MAQAQPLSELATIIRSKNAGPFRLTFDIMLPDVATFERVRKSGKMNVDSVAQIFQMDGARIASIFAVPAANAFKITLKRPLQCRFGESDVYGCQQHTPLLSVMID